jgi:GTP-binding protein
MFVDRVHIRVTGGAGGNGCCSFRREKYIPRGGPNGGDGGDGGDVIFVASSRLTSLLDLRYQRHIKAERGVHGKGSDMHGRHGQDNVVRVPLGTIIRDAASNEAVADLVEEGQQFIASRGGKGGRGNARFTTPTQKAPRFCEVGEPGEDKEFLVELKLIAEIGLVGLPNAGKSTFLAAVTEATPKIADYPFTTLSPNLGVARLSDHRSLTIADIPGIIEGAAEGKGLGHDFLRHIERTKVLVMLIDLGDPDPLATRDLLDEELRRHSAAFADRPRIYALNKVDITENRERSEEIKALLGNARCISGVTGEGMPELLENLWEAVQREREREQAVVVPPEEHDYIFEAPFTIEREGDVFVVSGKNVLRAVRMTDFNNDEGIRHLQQRLQKMGLFKALKRLGAESGQTIMIGDVELEYEPD